jgi:hypothetical protein
MSLVVVKNGPDALEMGCRFYPPKADIGQATLLIAISSSLVAAPSRLIGTWL